MYFQDTFLHGMTFMNTPKQKQFGILVQQFRRFLFVLLLLRERESETKTSWAVWRHKELQECKQCLFKQLKFDEYSRIWLLSYGCDKGTQQQRNECCLHSMYSINLSMYKAFTQRSYGCQYVKLSYESRSIFPILAIRCERVNWIVFIWIYQNHKLLSLCIALAGCIFASMFVLVLVLAMSVSVALLWQMIVF